MEHTVTGVGVIDKAVNLLELVRTRPRTLAELARDSGIARATTHRLATSLERHGLLRRDERSRYHIGLATISYAAAARDSMPLEHAARPALMALRDETGESAQLYVRQGDERICLTSLESPHGLRTIVRAGERLPLHQGSGGRVLLHPRRQRSWIQSVGEREPGVASVSAPVVDADGTIVAAVSISGPIDRLGTEPGRAHGPAVEAAARAVEVAAGFR